MATELILHHYDPSPFSEKVRLVLGLKGLAWSSVIVPMVLPKPSLMPLTGGNRRTPVLQIGANIYCGTNVIAAELERRFPAVTIYPDNSRGICELLSLWADQLLFVPSSAYAIRDRSHFPPSFYEDRRAMRGHATVATTETAPHHLEQLQLQLGYVESALSNGTPFILGAQPSLADFAVYARVWWAQLFGGDQGELAALPLVSSWQERIKSLGHGTRCEMTPEEALATARAAEPEVVLRDGVASTTQLGRRIAMAVEGFGPDPVEGEVAAIADDHIALRRHDPTVGDVIVHLPRQGYQISNAQGRDS